MDMDMLIMIYDKFSIFKKIYERLFLDKYQKSYIDYNLKKIKQDNSTFENRKAEILIEQSTMQPFIFGLSYFSNILAEHYDAKILSFGNKGKLRSYTLEKIYKSFNTLYNIFDDSVVLDKDWNRFIKLETKKISKKEDLLNYSYRGISIGVDVYSTYLRIFNKATINFKDENFKKLLKKAIIMTDFWSDYLKKHDVKAVVVSHPCYIKSNIIAKIARKNGIKVYLLAGLNYIGLEDCDYIEGRNFLNYNDIWRALDRTEQEQGLEWAHKQLQRRFSGEVGVDMSYSKKSSFGKIDYNDSVLKKSDKPKILICSHMFSDNPYCYGDLLFPDFYEWLVFLGEQSEKLDYDWYIKMHPDYLEETKYIIEKFLKKYPKIKMINPNVSHLQLAYEGINCVLTVYGTVGCEYPLLGIPVINAGFNPHISYNFNYHPKTVEEYKKLLRNIKQLNTIYDKNEIYKFYYIHHHYGKYDAEYKIKDNLFINSYKKLKEKIDYKSLFSNNIYSTLINDKNIDMSINISCYMEKNKLW